MGIWRTSYGLEEEEEVRRLSAVIDESKSGLREIPSLIKITSFLPFNSTSLSPYNPSRRLIERQKSTYDTTNEEHLSQDDDVSLSLCTTSICGFHLE